VVFVDKKFALLLPILLIISGMFLFESCVVAEIKPAAPSFTVQEISQPYDVPPTTTTTVNQYTGEEKTITYPGYTVENKTTYLVIKNQPFTPYKNNKGETINLYYYYAYRGHYYVGEGGWSSGRFQYYAPSDSEYTLIPFDGTIPSSGKIDIRVKAVIGTLEPIFPGLEGSDVFYFNFEGVEGDYSVVTVSRDMVVSTVLPSSSVLPTRPESSDPSMSDNFNSPPPQKSPWATNLLIVIATICIVTIPLTIVMYFNRQRKNRSMSDSAGVVCEVSVV